MIVLNLQNVEQVVFRDPRLEERLHGLRHTFEQWRLSQRIPYLRPQGLQAQIDLLNGLDSEHLAILEEFLGDQVVLEKASQRVVIDLSSNLTEAEDVLNHTDTFDNFAVSRDAGRVRVCFWR